MSSCVLDHPCFLIASEAEEGLRAAWPESAYCLVVCAGLEFPTAAGLPHGSYSVIASHSLCKLMLSLFLMGVKKKNSGGGGKQNLWKWWSLKSLKRFKIFLAYLPIFSLQSKHFPKYALYVLFLRGRKYSSLGTVLQNVIFA